MKYARIGALAALLLLPTIAVVTWVHSAEARLSEADAEAAAPAPAQGSGSGSVAVAAEANAQYCSPELKKILRRVLLSCGLVSGGGAGGDARGCQPVQAKNVATMSGADFNALFQPMQDRGGIIEFDKDSSTLDADDATLIDKLWGDQGGASWFFIVARASPDGSVSHNRELSRARAQAVMDHLKKQFPDDPDLDQEAGLLWLGEEYAQLDDQFCAWRRSNGATCSTEDLNRSAFVAWIDCQL